jgi:hypothetical protein
MKEEILDGKVFRVTRGGGEEIQCFLGPRKRILGNSPFFKTEAINL